MLTRTILVVAMFAAPASATDAAREVPQRFLGDWCTLYQPGEEETGESDIRITATEVIHYRAEALILSAASLHDRLALIVKVKQDGLESVGAEEYELSGDGKRLMSVREDGQLHTRVRCSGSSEAPPNNSSKPTPLRGAA